MPEPGSRATTQLQGVVLWGFLAAMVVFTPRWLQPGGFVVAGPAVVAVALLGGMGLSAWLTEARAPLLRSLRPLAFALLAGLSLVHAASIGAGAELLFALDGLLLIAALAWWGGDAKSTLASVWSIVAVALLGAVLPGVVLTATSVAPLLLGAALATSLVLRQQEQARALRRLEREQARRERVDTLTGVLQRAALVEAAGDVLAETSAALLSVSVDHLRRLNQTYGHALGDRVLVHLGSRLAAGRVPGDAVGRMDGPVMGLLLPEVTAETAHALAESFRQGAAIGAPMPLTVSVGVALAEPGEGFGPVWERADAARQRAKASGRNCVVVAGAAGRRGARRAQG